jgi:hypothetical protein
MSISGILESLATYYKERMFGKIHELTYNTENALFDGLTATNRPPFRKAIIESVNLDLSGPKDEHQALYNIQHTPNSITITFPGYGSQQAPKYDYRHGLADIHISGPGWSSIKLMAGSAYIVTEYNIPDPEKNPLNHILWQTDAGRAIPFIMSQDLEIIIILLEPGHPTDIQLSFNIVELDNPVNTEVSNINKPETSLTFPVLTMATHDAQLTGTNPQYISLPFTHPVLALIIQIVGIPINSAVFIPFPFNDKYNYKIPLELNKDSGSWELVFQNPVAPLAELFNDKTTINFTTLANPDAVLVITPDTSTADEIQHSWQVNIWAIQRNICRVMSGMAGLAFA